ncbi:MAG: hypothetical protein ABG776_18775 [Cyanobacteria bacterium J06555_13]
MAAEKPEAKFRRDAVAVMSNHAEAVTLRLDRTEKAVADLTSAVQQQAQNLSELSANVARMERGISQIVAENAAQRETVNNLIKLCTTLVEQRAS